MGQEQPAAGEQLQVPRHVAGGAQDALHHRLQLAVAGGEQGTDRKFVGDKPIVLHQGSRVLEVEFDSGENFRLPCELLRVFSPSAEVMGHGRALALGMDIRDQANVDGGVRRIVQEFGRITAAQNRP